MLPQGSLNDVLYPMSADIYYSSETQNDFGEVYKSWSIDRTIKCSAIKENPQSQMRQNLTSEKFLEYEVKINMRTSEDIHLSKNGNYYKPTEILINNIKDPSGSPVWNESSIKTTSFEIDTIEPMYDHLHNLAGYRVLLRRSDLQVDV